MPADSLSLQDHILLQAQRTLLTILAEVEIAGAEIEE
jgi:hypothetical protein